MGVEWDGTDRAADRISRAVGGVIQALRGSLFDEGTAIMAESIPEVPVDTGNLRNSHFERPVEEAGRIGVEVGYGGAAAPYAIPVHERIGPRHDPPTKAKFLEDPALRRVSGMEARIAAGVIRRLRGNI